MHCKHVLIVTLVAVAQAQVPPGVANPAAPNRPGGPVKGDPHWRRNLLGVIGQQPGRASMRDIQNIEQYMLSAAPYCTSLSPGDYEANRELARQMTAYLMSVNAAATDPQLRAAAVRATRTVAAFPCAYPQALQPHPAPAAAAPEPHAASEPPFTINAPSLGKVTAADKATAADLVARYETDTGNAVTAWRNAETTRANLNSRGMSLNADTEAAVSRLQLFFEEAATALREHRWDDALSSLQGAEAITQKIAKTVGQ